MQVMTRDVVRFADHRQRPHGARGAAPAALCCSTIAWPQSKGASMWREEQRCPALPCQQCAHLLLHGCHESHSHSVAPPITARASRSCHRITTVISMVIMVAASCLLFCRCLRAELARCAA